jgi:hypothetical protein
LSKKAEITFSFKKGIKTPIQSRKEWFEVAQKIFLGGEWLL